MGDKNGDSHTKKGKKNKCEKGRRITILIRAYKLFAYIMENRLNERVEDEMVEEMCGFKKESSCTHAIFTVQQIIEKRSEHSFLYL